MQPIAPLLLFLSLLTPVWGWGMLGHRTTALLATRYLTRPTSRQIRQLLKPQSLVTASTWADYYSHTPHGRYSAPWHWIDAHDSPPSKCGVDYSRDCGETGCIVSALKNHTARVNDKSLDWEQRQMSLKWVVHFVGDIHQPLHTEDLARGGNSIHVKFGGRNTNLHHVWDSSIAEKIVGGGGIKDAVNWANDLYERIQKGEFRTEGKECKDLTKAEDCALQWASETNMLMCGYVIPEGGLDGKELSGEYYEGAVEIVEKQIALAGYRMGMWLNQMFEGQELEESLWEQMVGLWEEL
ncbi:phospholipase C/P1 nuclease domain-containing protein [Pyronema domesticum]|nr:phospholipase C/P1 nuclease domain-containing protein [Pyronema domesticum]